MQVIVFWQHGLRHQNHKACDLILWINVPFGVLCVSDDILQKDLKDATGLLINEAEL